MRKLIVAFVVVFGLAGASASAQTTVFSDNCDSTVDESVVAPQVTHATTTGTSPFWVETEDTGTDDVLQAHASTDNCRFTPGDSSDRAIYTVVPSATLGADYDLSIKINANLNGQTDQDPLGLVMRLSDVSNYYVCLIDSAASQSWFIAERAAGTTTQIGSATGAVTVANGDVFKCSIRGDTIKFYQNGVQLGCVTDGTLSAAGLAGVASGNFFTNAVADTNVSWEFDTVLLVDQTGQGGDDDCNAATRAPSLLLLGA